MDEMSWSLGAARSDPSDPRGSRLEEAKELTEQEFNRMASDMDFLRSLGGHSLIAALVDKLNAVAQIEVELDDDPHIYRDARFGYRLTSEVDAFLSEVTAFRSRIEALAKEYLPAYVPRIKDLFSQIHDENAYYRLVWELRNSSQHGVGATRHFHLYDSNEGKLWAVHLPALFAEHVGEKRWDAAAALFDTLGDVRVIDVLHGAYSASSKVLAEMLVENEMEIAAVVDRIAQAIAEGVGDTPGFPTAWALRRTGDTTFIISELGLDPLVVGYAIGSLHGARSTLGLPPSARFPPVPAGEEEKSVESEALPSD